MAVRGRLKNKILFRRWQNQDDEKNKIQWWTQIGDWSNSGTQGPYRQEEYLESISQLLSSLRDSKPSATLPSQSPSPSGALGAVDIGSTSANSGVRLAQLER